LGVRSTLALFSTEVAFLAATSFVAAAAAAAGVNLSGDPHMYGLHDGDGDGGSGHSDGGAANVATARVAQVKVEGGG
jgi:hypothetical protein